MRRVRKGSKREKNTDKHRVTPEETAHVMQDRDREGTAAPWPSPPWGSENSNAPFKYGLRDHLGTQDQMHLRDPSMKAGVL